MLDPNDPAFRKAAARSRAWNWRSYDRALLIAVAYPIGLPLLIWMLSGTPGQLGGLEIVPPPTHWWQFPLAWLAIAGLIFNHWIARVLHRWIVWPLLNRIFPVRPAGSEPLAIRLGHVQGALVVAVAFACAFAFAIPGAVAFAITMTFAFAGAFAAAGAAAVALALAVALAIAGAGAIAGAMAGAVAAAGAGAAAVAVDSAITRRWHPMPVLLAFSLIAVAALLWAASFPSTESREAAPMLLLFLGLFPLLNAVWDFASLGLTRYCLRQSLVDAPLGPLPASFRPLVFNLIDLIGALLALGGLILSLLFAVSAMNHLAPEPILPLTRLILDLRPGAGGPDMTWAYLMVFSTLLPSLAHLLIFLISLVLRYPGRKLRRWMAQRPPADDAAKTAHADAAALMIALWVTLPVAVIALAFWYLLPGIPEFHENSLTWLLAQISWLVAVFELS